MCIRDRAKALFGIKLVFVSYDLYPEVATVTGTLGEKNPICRLMNHINRCICKRADRIVALSREMKDYIRTHRDFPAERIDVIPNWYEDKGVLNTNREHNPFRDITKNRFTVSYFCLLYTSLPPTWNPVWTRWRRASSSGRL